ncbi:MAG: hypothetical protein R2861_16695 [Desulfobacterales bacterium]
MWKRLLRVFGKTDAIDGLRDTSLTTNGIPLKDHRCHCRLRDQATQHQPDTLQPGKYERITGCDGFYRVWEGILQFLKKDFIRSKLIVWPCGALMMMSRWPLRNFPLDTPCTSGLSSSCPLGKTCIPASAPLLIPEIRNRIEALASWFFGRPAAGDGPAMRY